MKKTNAMRILDSKGINYNVLEYKVDDGQIDGISVAKKTHKEFKEVYKTLVTKGLEEIYVFIIPVEEHLDLKKAAKHAREKRIEFININDILKTTGYIRGGCSPVGMKKRFKTFIQKDSLDLKSIIVSGGKIGLQIELDPLDLKKVIDVEFVDII
ncbi:Cys-tRNA(Pro) deacylase [Tissierella creatinophila]|uniref:Cys-tRNA(Pro)/Cys-tRNA(Cys) deacylase n=1 Tax=Tissierella creatinophila DSM 6911 TaxID=1123403 RepID=A0A1U7M6M7_TISCR|nr:Cys-tRNA(Pro) deacylase [Tissierella creatinophila]OLS02984.1 Cys-tRNA(Pro)/Cys-tRNA(Cys) deacylase YbaK [Tissierella creatinophila DSM 6911]